MARRHAHGRTRSTRRTWHWRCKPAPSIAWLQPVIGTTPQRGPVAGTPTNLGVSACGAHPLGSSRRLDCAADWPPLPHPMNHT
eukprot:scaffold5763_cov111-Isochrysis_galbana.AAC.3